MARQRRKPGAWTSAEGRAAFANWLQARVAEDGRALHVIAQEADVAREAMRRILREPGAGMFEPSVRKLAVFFGADPDEIAALAGYTDVRVAPTDPRLFATLADLLRATLAARSESPRHAALAVGLDQDVVRRIIERGLTPKRPTLRALASYFGWDPIEILAFRRKQPARVAAGKRIAERLGHAHMAAIAAIGRPLSHQTAEERRGFGRLAGTTTARIHGAELYRRMQTRAVAVVRERGFLYRNDASRAGYLAKVRGSFGEKRAKKAWETRRARYSDEHIRAVAKRAAAPRHNVGPARDRAVAYLKLARIWRQVKHSPDIALRQYVEKRIQVARKQLATPSRGARATILRERDMAIRAARLHDEGSLTARKIGEVLGYAREISDDGTEGTSRSAQRLIRFGRALIGNVRAQDQSNDLLS